MIKIFTEKTYLIRIVTQPYMGYDHRVTVNRDRVRCTYTSHCPLCVRGFVKDQFWVLGCIDRLNENTYSIYRMDFRMFRTLQKFIQSPTWGNPIGYDIQLNKDPDDWGDHYYDILGVGKTPLTAADRQIVDNIDRTTLIKFTAPYPIDCVNTQIRRLRVNL